MTLYALKLVTLAFMALASILSLYVIGCASKDCVAHLKTIWKDAHAETNKEAE